MFVVQVLHAINVLQNPLVVHILILGRQWLTMVVAYVKSRQIVQMALVTTAASRTLADYVLLQVNVLQVNFVTL